MARTSLGSDVDQSGDSKRMDLVRDRILCGNDRFERLGLPSLDGIEAESNTCFSSSALASSRQAYRMMGSTAVRQFKDPARAGAGELANLDFLRSVAVCLVFLNHLGPPLGIRGVAALGHLGVLLFFVHTALVLMMSMERLRLSGRTLYLAFMIRRVFRIYPLSILSTVAILWFAIPPDSWGSQYAWPGWGTVFSNFALLQNVTNSVSINAVLWSLPFEVQMYALLPLLFLWLARDASARSVFAAWLVAVALPVTEYVLRGGGADLEQNLLTRYFPCFMGGLIAWRGLKFGSRKLPGWLWPVCLAAAIGTYRVLWAIKAFGFTALLNPNRLGARRLPAEWPLYVDILLEGSLCALIGFSIPWFREIGAAWLKLSSNLIARYSYGIYLSHSAAIWLCFGKWSTGSTAMNLAASVVLTAALSLTAYHLIEDPFIRLGKQLATSAVRARRTHIADNVLATAAACAGTSE